MISKNKRLKIILIDVNAPFKVDLINSLNEKAEIYSIIFLPFQKLFNNSIENIIKTNIARIYFLPKYYKNRLSYWFVKKQFNYLVNKIKPDVLIITSPFYEMF